MKKLNANAYFIANSWKVRTEFYSISKELNVSNGLFIYLFIIELKNEEVYFPCH